MSLKMYYTDFAVCYHFCVYCYLEFCTALLETCTSKSVCLPFLQSFLFGFGICKFCLLELLRFASFQCF